MLAPARSTSASSWSGGGHAVDQALGQRLSALMNSPVTSISKAALRDRLRLSATLGVLQNRPRLTPLTAKRASRRHRQVAHRHQLAAGGGGDALHLGDHRHGQALDGQHHAAALREQRW
jgi:hypothetical protein